MIDTRDDSNTPWAIHLLLKAGLQNQRQAEVVLIAFVVLCLFFTVWTAVPRKTVPPQSDVQQNPNYEPTTAR